MNRTYWSIIPAAILVLCLTACACKHEWTEAACLTARNCALCGETQGDPLGHSWAEATCELPKTCVLCGETEGEAPGHSWAEATCETPKMCALCGKTQGESLGHAWREATCVEAESCIRCAALGAQAQGHTYGAWECDGESFARACENCVSVEELSPEAFFIQLLTGKRRALVYTSGGGDLLHPEDYMTVHPDGSVALTLNQKVPYPETAQLVKEAFAHVEFPMWEGWRMEFFLENEQWWEEMMGPECPRELGLFLMVDYAPAPCERLDITLHYPGYHDMWIFECTGVDFGEIPE